MFVRREREDPPSPSQVPTDTADSLAAAVAAASLSLAHCTRGCVCVHQVKNE